MSGLQSSEGHMYTRFGTIQCNGQTAINVTDTQPCHHSTAAVIAFRWLRQKAGFPGTVSCIRLIHSTPEGCVLSSVHFYNSVYK